MWSQKKNLNTLRVITLCHIEILIQVVFLIWFCIPALHWTENNICFRVDLIQSGINLQYNPTPLSLWSMWTITTYKKQKLINQVRKWKTKKCENIWSDSGSENMFSRFVWYTRIRLFRIVEIWDIWDILIQKIEKTRQWHFCSIYHKHYLLVVG